ncbi:MAG: c-type cytochrome domain-containing protein [Planctomycetaceae bacterium]
MTIYLPTIRRTVLWTASLCLCSTGWLCAEDKPVEKVTFKDNVLPIFRARCGSCHNGNDRKGGLILDDYGGMMQGGSSGGVVEPGDADASYLWLLVTHESEPKMPPNADKLPETELAMIRRWIEGGLLETSTSTAKMSDKPSLAKVEIVPGKRPEQIAMPGRYLGDPTLVTPASNAVTALAVSPWAPLGAVSSHKQVAVFNTQTLQVLGVLPFPEGQPEIIRFSSQGDLLLVGGGRGGASGKVVVFDVRTGERRIEVGDEYDAVLSADISPDQSLIALGGPKRMLRVYSTATGELLYEKKKHTDWITAVCFSPDGVLLASGDRANGLVVWEAHTGQIFYDLVGHKGAINDISWRPDSNVLASGSEDGNIKLWDMNNGAEIKNWSAHGGGVQSVDYTRDGQLVSVGRDNVARLWNGDGTKVLDFGGLQEIGMEVAYDAESKRVLSGDWKGNVIVWNGADAKELGRMDTSPPTIAMRIAELSQTFASVQKDAAGKSSQLDGMQKQIAERQAAADKALADANAMMEKAKAAAAAKAAAEQEMQSKQAELAKKTEMLKAAQTQAAANQEALTKTAKILADAEAALTQAKQAFEAATKSKESSATALAEAQKAMASVDAAKTQATSLADAAQKSLAEAQAAEKASVDAANAAKAAADKAMTEAKMTDEQQKALQQAQADAEAAKKKVAELQAQLDQLKATQQQLAAKKE